MNTEEEASLYPFVFVAVAGRSGDATSPGKPSHASPTSEKVSEAEIGAVKKSKTPTEELISLIFGETSGKGSA